MFGVTGLLRSAAGKNADGTAVVYGERAHTWSGLLDRVSRAAGALVQLGVAGGDRVAILALNSDRYLEAYFAVPWAGGVLEPLNIRWSSQENAFAVRAGGATTLLVDDTFVDQARELHDLCPGIDVLVHIGDGEPPAGMFSYDELLRAAEPAPDAGRCGRDPYAVLYTSGTTSRSKGVVVSHDNALVTALTFAATIPLSPSTRHLHLLGWFHVGGAQPLWYTTMVAGTHVVHHGFDPSATLRAIAEDRVTNTVLVPTMVSMLLRSPNLAAHDLSSLQTCVYGGSPMPLTILEEATRTLPGCRFHQIYGQNECCGYATALSWADHRRGLAGDGRLLESAGTAVPGTEVGIVDVDGDPVPAGTVGEIQVRGGTVMLGYFENPDETERTIQHGWLRTGDAGYLDADGHLFVVDRLKDMIVTGGENVYSVDVERALHEHPAVQECAVIGIPDPTWIEAVHAVVVLKEGTTADERELSEHCHGLIAGYKCPRSFEFVSGPLPTTPVGKIRKNVLRERRVHQLDGAAAGGPTTEDGRA